jgi:hypothetical protein
MSIIGRWTFAGLGGPWDETELWQSVEFIGNARLTHRGLELRKDGWARVRPAPGANFNIGQKTLIAWLILDDLTDKRPAGSVLTLDTIQRDEFDGIVFGERQDATWEAGSSRFKRTASLTSENPSEQETGKLVKMAITYADAGRSNVEIKIYRNDKLMRTYQQGQMATWSPNNVEIIFGARHTLRDRNRGYLNATIVAAEIHDETLSAEALSAREYTDTCTFVRRSVSFQSVNFPNRYLVTNADSSGIQLLSVNNTADDGPKKRATFTIIPGLADPTMVSIQVYQPSGAYVVAKGSGVAVERPDGTDDFRQRATFEKVEGLDGSGWSFKSLAQPAHYLRHQNYILKLHQSDGSELFKKDATFDEVDGFISSITTELPLNDQSWYIISNHYYAPSKVLGIRSDGVVDLVDLPTSGSIDHVLWRLVRMPLSYAGAGPHRWTLINKKIGDGKRLDSGKEAVSMAPAKGVTGQLWTIRPIPWMGSDYFAMTNDFIEPDKNTLDCGAALSHGGVSSSPRVASINLDRVGQRWRFTFMSYVEGVERPTPPERIKAVYGDTSHNAYVQRYPKFAGALGMDYVATESVSDWAVVMARTVLTNLLLTFKNRRNIEKFKGYRILIVGDGDGDEAVNYPDINFPEFKEWRGGTNFGVARVTKEMMCRTGITHRPDDTTYRKYDQVIHEFGHTIDMRLDLKAELTEVQGGTYDAESFPWWVQSWFNCAMIWGPNGTRSGFSTSRPKEATFVKTLFLANREWFPYEVHRRYGV